ncbi:translation initiation factor 2 [Streptomyces sp. NPDC048623]|uniref:translation initiation factor 2 n=1 Tax=Streptomyces sp. NPDC048623 TaxID=3155761 RepID=UPI0034290727
MGGQRAAGSGQRAGSRQRVVLVAVRSAAALHRVLDVLPVFRGDARVKVRFTLVPGSDFGVDALAALDRSGARVLAWEDARRARHDLILAASPKGDLHELRGPRVLLPHGAGFNKAVRDDGSTGVASGLDPHYLLRTDGTPWADLHAFAHGDQVTRLAAHCPPAADRAAVVGDPTLDRLLASVPRRDAYRDALGTGSRRLVVLTSTWGAESLLGRRTELPAELTGHHPHDAYQFALVVHPNTYSGTGSFDLARHLAPALDAGLVLARPYEEWAALLVAADAVVSDHGSTALYAAALGRRVVNAYDGGQELLPGSPMARLLDSAPKLASATDLEAALHTTSPADDPRAHAAHAFAREDEGQALTRLRERLYPLLGLRPPAHSLEAAAFPSPGSAPRRPPAFVVRAEPTDGQVSVRRFPVHSRQAPHHLAAEDPTAGPRPLQSAAVLWRRAGTGAPETPYARTAWTAEGWTARALTEYPGCRTATAVLTHGRLLLRHRAAGLFSVSVEPHREGGRVTYPDPPAVASAVHAWLGAGGRATGQRSLTCVVGTAVVRVRLGPARPEDLDYEL